MIPQIPQIPIPPGFASTAPVSLTVLVILLVILLGGTRMAYLAQVIRLQLIQRRRPAGVDPALIYVPRGMPVGHLVGVVIGTITLSIVVFSQLGPIWIAMVVFVPLTLIVVGVASWAAARRAAAQIDAALPSAVGRLALQVQSNLSFPSALDRVIQDMPAAPLTDEWRFIRERIGSTLQSGRQAAAGDVVAALLNQTTSRRHASFLAHLEVALTSEQSALRRRISAASERLYESDRRKSQAMTELAQIRYSAYVIAGAGIAMNAYMALAQHDRFVRAYTGPLGSIVGPVIVAALITPIIAGIVMTTIPDIE